MQGFQMISRRGLTRHKLKFAAGQSSWLDDWLMDGSPQDAVYTWTIRKAATATRESRDGGPAPQTTSGNY